MGEVETAELRRLALLWRELNDRHFGGQLKQPAIRLLSPSDLEGRSIHRVVGELAEDGAIELAWGDGRSPSDRDATLLHEMVHQWQAHTGRQICHDADFDAMAEAVGLPPYDDGYWSEPIPMRHGAPQAAARDSEGRSLVRDDRSPSDRERRESLIEQARLRRARASARRPRRSLPKKGGR